MANHAKDNVYYKVRVKKGLVATLIKYMQDKGLSTSEVANTAFGEYLKKRGVSVDYIPKIMDEPLPENKKASKKKSGKSFKKSKKKFGIEQCRRHR